MLNKQHLWIGIVALCIGIGIGWLTNNSESIQDPQSSVLEKQTWTCSMHPQIQQPEAGDCPLCGMDLIPISQEDSEDRKLSIRMSHSAMQLANVQTTKVQRKIPEKSLRVSGMVRVAEDKKHAITAHISGRIERLMVGFEGEQIQKGQILAWVYSPELLTAQKELLEAWRNRAQSPRLYQSVRAKLLNWKMSDKQIDQILKQGTPQEEIPIYAELSGTVLKKNVLVGDHVQSGEVLVEVADLSSVWVVFDVYESDLAWVHQGDVVEFYSKSRPDRVLSGTVSFIDPMINPQTRTINVRVEVTNLDGTLKPAEFVVGHVQSALETTSLIVPKTSVLWTGERSVVYVKDSHDTFIMRVVDLGLALSDGYVVVDGLTEGDLVVTHGAFSIDSAAQLLGRPSMMSMQDDAELLESSTVTVEQVEFSKANKETLTRLYKAYLDLKTDLVNDDFDAAHQNALVLNSVFESISKDVFNEPSDSTWSMYSQALAPHLRLAMEANSIQAIRTVFKPMSATMIALIQVVGPIDVPLYIEHCPMAENNSGADWLSSESEIRNPYFGAAMLRCGELKGEIQ